MVYKATQDVVHRVRPLLDRLATRTVDKARLLQYLSARAGEAWGVLELVADEPNGQAFGTPTRVLTFRDRLSGAEHQVRFPVCLVDLPPDVEELVREEYQRLAMDRPLTTMAPDLFAHFFAASHCQSCRWRGPAFAQFHRECHFAGHPINHEPEG
jgi:hypothetical protein